MLYPNMYLPTISYAKKEHVQIYSIHKTVDKSTHIPYYYRWYSVAAQISRGRRRGVVNVMWPTSISCIALLETPTWWM